MALGSLTAALQGPHVHPEVSGDLRVLVLLHPGSPHDRCARRRDGASGNRCEQESVGPSKAWHLGVERFVLGRRHCRAPRIGHILERGRTRPGSTTARTYRFRTSQRMLAATAVGRRTMR
ncbi:MAG: hypothetical protein M3P85_08905 [Actinomycetota bacterium]|nr:hypothetical protein [Actinomycetota bacterium]